MTRSPTRMAAGTVTAAIVGAGSSLAAPAAIAGTGVDNGLTTLDTLEVTEFTYACATTDGVDSDDDVAGIFAVDAAPTAETGQSLEVIGEGRSTVFYYPGEVVAAGDATVTMEFELRGDAAPRESVSFGTATTGEVTPATADEFIDQAEWTVLEPEVLDLTRPGTIEYVPSTVTYEVAQASGESVTVCEPNDEVTAIAATEVTGDAVQDAAADEGDEHTPAGEEPAAEQGGLPPSGLIVAVVALAGVVALGGAVALFFLLRRRS